MICLFCLTPPPPPEATKANDGLVMRLKNSKAMRLSKPCDSSVRGRMGQLLTRLVDWLFFGRGSGPGLLDQKAGGPRPKLGVQGISDGIPSEKCRKFKVMQSVLGEFVLVEDFPSRIEPLSYAVRWSFWDYTLNEQLLSCSGHGPFLATS